MKNFCYSLAGLMSFCTFHHVAVAVADEAEPVRLESITVVGDTPIQGSLVAKDKVPTNVQIVTSNNLQNAQSLTISDYMNRYLGSVNIIPTLL